MTHVHYKFSSKRSYDTVVFDGPHVTVRELKRLIVGKERLRAADCDLQITNAQTKEEYADDEGLISKGSSVIVKRIPLSGVKSGSSKTHNTERLDIQHHHAFGVAKAKDDQGSSSALPFFAKMANLADSDVPEADKLKLIMNQSTYDPMSYKKFGAALPSNYTCYRCGNAGHHIRNCPISGEKNLDAPPRIKKSTGIPRSFMVEVDDPTIKGAMLTNCGRYAIPAIDREAYAIGKKEKPPFVPQEQPKVVVKEDPIPEELLCLICHDLLSDAVVIPCCGNSYCDDCIRSALLDSEEHVCPTCSQSDVSPDTLIANKFLRQAVNNFKKERGDSKNPNRNPSASHSLNPTATPSPAPTLPPFALQNRALKLQQLTHKGTQQDPLLPLPSADVTLPSSKACAAPPAETSAASTSAQPLQNVEAEVKTHNDDLAPVSNDDPVTDPLPRVTPVINDPVAKQADSVNPLQSSSASRPCAPSACWDSSSSSLVRPAGGWTESTAQPQPPPASSSSSYTAIPPPLFPSPHFPMYLPAQQPLTTYSPGYPPATPVWTLPSPQSAPIPSLGPSTAASPIPALMSKEWLRHQRMKRERSPHRESSSRRSSSRSNSGSSKAKSSRSYSRSSSRSRSRSRSRSKGRSRPHSPYSRPRVPHTRAHSSRSYTYSYKRSPTPSSSSSPKVGHHSKSKSQSDHRKSRHHSRKSGSGSHGSSRWQAERSPTPERGPQPAPGNPDVNTDQYLQWKQQYKEWYDKYFSSYVNHFQQLPPSPFTLPPPPPDAQWGEEARPHRERSHSRRSPSHDRRSPPSQSSSESRSPPSRSSSSSRSPPSHLSSDAGSTPSKGGALQPSCVAKNDPGESNVGKEAIAEKTEDLEASRKHEEGEIEEESPTPVLGNASNALQATHLPQKYVETSSKTHERKGKEERSQQKERGSRRSKESDSRQDKVKTPKEAKRVDRDKRTNHKSSKSSHSSSEKRRKREREDTEESIAVRTPTVEQPKSPHDHIGEARQECDAEKQQVEDERETEASPLQEGEIWEGGITVKPPKKISISINLNTKWTERTEKQDLSQLESIVDESKEGTEVAGIDEFHRGETEIQAEEEKESATDEKTAKEKWRKDAFIEDKEEACEAEEEEKEEERQEEEKKEEIQEEEKKEEIQEEEKKEEIQEEEKQEEIQEEEIQEEEKKEEIPEEEIQEEEKKEEKQEEELHFWSSDFRGAEEKDGTGAEKGEDEGKGENAHEENSREVERVSATEGVERMTMEGDDSMMSQRSEEVSSTSMADSGQAGKCEESSLEVETPEVETPEVETPEESTHTSKDTLLALQVSHSKWEKEEPEQEEQGGGEFQNLPEAPTPMPTGEEAKPEPEEKTPNLADMKRLWEKVEEKEADTCLAPPSGRDPSDATLSTDSGWKGKLWLESERAEEKHSSITSDPKSNLPALAPPSPSSTFHDAEGRDGQDATTDSRTDRNLLEAHTRVHKQTNTRGKGEEENDRDAARHDPRLSPPSHSHSDGPRDPRVGSHAWAGGPPTTGAVRPDRRRPGSQHAAATASSSKHQQAQRNSGKKESREQQWKRYKLDQLMKEKQQRRESGRQECEAGPGEKVAVQGEDGEAEGEERSSIHGGGRSAASNDDKRGEEKRDNKHKREDAAELEEDELKKPTKKKREEETGVEADDSWKDEEYRKLFSVMLS